jgi:hypothetical protein
MIKRVKNQNVALPVKSETVIKSLKVKPSIVLIVVIAILAPG